MMRCMNTSLSSMMEFISLIKGLINGLYIWALYAAGGVFKVLASDFQRETHGAGEARRKVRIEI